MDLRSFLKTKGVLGTRTICAIDGFLHNKRIATGFDEWVGQMTAACLKTGKCQIRNLGKKGLLLLTEFYKLEVPEKADSVPALKASLTMARKRIEALQQEITVLRASSSSPSSPAASPVSRPQT